MKAPFPSDEAERLEALRRYGVLDTTAEQEFDDLTHLAAHICGTPFSAITLVDHERQWFKSRVGSVPSETPRDVSFCAHTILDDDLLLVSDVSVDERFADNPFVTSEPHIRFYAGAPLVTPEGHAVGTLCVLDTMPRQIDHAQQDALRRLARHAVALLEARPDSTAEKGQSRHARQQAEHQRLTLAAEAARQDADSLKASEERYRRLFEAARDGILILDAASGEIEDVNPYLCEFLGNAPGEFLGKQLWEIGTFHDIAASQEAFRTLQEKEYIRYNDLPLETKDGHRASVEFISNVYVAGDKNVIQCNIRDISERKQAQAVVQEARRFLQSTLDALASHIAVLDENGEVVSVNKAWRQFSEENGGTDFSCGVGANYIEVCDRAMGAQSEESQVLAEGLREVMAGQHHAFCLEYPCHSPEEERWFNVCVTRFEGEGPVRVAVAHENITMRKQAEATLSKREEFQRTLLDNFPNGSVNVFDRELRYELAAGRGLEQSGIDPGQLIGRTLAEIFPPEQAALAKSHYEKALSGQTVEFELPLGDRCYSICAAPLHVHDGEVLNIVAVAQDITGRKQAETQLLASEANLRAAQQMAHIGSWELDLTNLNDINSNPLRWSDEIFRIFGYQPGQIAASNENFFNAVHPDDRERIAAAIVQAVLDGQAYKLDHRVLLPDGSQRIVHEQAEIALDERTSRPLKMLGTVQDITEQKQIEEAMRQGSEQLRALAASLSTIREEERTQIARDVHDVLGQALTSLKMDVAWLEEKLIASHTDPEGSLLRKIRSMLQHIDTTIQSVQRIASQLRPALLDDFGLEAAIEWQVQEWKERTHTQCDYISSLGDVALSPEQSTAVFRILQEALTNITRHAAASRISILLEENAGHLILEVHDNGRGMEERRASVARVKSLGMLGMQERARLVGGEATINSVGGKGTTVTVRIPLSPEQIQGLHQAEAGREEQA